MVSIIVANQNFVELCQPKELKNIVDVIIKKKSIYYFDSESTYKLFLNKICKEIQPKSAILVSKVFKEMFGLKYEMVEFKSRDNKSIFLPAELLKTRIPYFKENLQKVTQTELSFKTLELFSFYVKDKEWKFTQAPVMKEFLLWSKTFSDDALNNDLQSKVTSYFLEKNHESDFEELHIPYIANSFILTFFRKLLKELVFSNFGMVIKWNDFFHLFTSKTNPIFLKFLAFKLESVRLVIDPKTNFKDFLEIPLGYRKIISHFVFDIGRYNSPAQIESLYKKVEQDFPTIDLFPLLSDDLTKKLKKADTPVKLVLCSSNARNTDQSREFLFEVQRHFAEKITTLPSDCSTKEVFFKEFKKLQEALLLNICFEENLNEYEESIKKTFSHLRKLQPIQNPLLLEICANVLLMAQIMGLENIEDATDYYYKALSKSPTHPILQRNIAYSLFLKGMSLRKASKSLPAQELFKLGTNYCSKANFANEDDYLTNHLRADLAFYEADYLRENQNFNGVFEKYQIAEKHYSKLYRKNKHNFAVLQNLAYTQFCLSQHLSKTENTSEALKKFEEAEQSYVELDSLRSNTFSTFKHLGEIHFEHANLLQKAALESNNLSEKRALKDKAQDNFEAAQIQFLRAILIKSQDFDILINLALTFYNQGLHFSETSEVNEADKKFKTALRYLTKVTPQDEDKIPFESLAFVHFQLASTSTRVEDGRNHAEKAIHFGLKAHKRDRKNFSVIECLTLTFNKLAEYYIRNEEHDEISEALLETINYASKGLDLKKDDKTLTQILAKALYLLATQDKEDLENQFSLSQKAEIWLCKALRQSPNDVLLQEYLAHIIFQQADYHLQKKEERIGFQRLIDAEQEYLKAGELNPKNFEIARDLENIIYLLIKFLDYNPLIGDVDAKFSDLQIAATKTLNIKPFNLTSVQYLSIALNYLAGLDIANKAFDQAEKRIDILISLCEGYFFFHKDALESIEVEHLNLRLLIAQFRKAICVFEKGQYKQALKKFVIIEEVFIKTLDNSTNLIWSAIYQFDCLMKLNLHEDAANKLADIERYISEYKYYPEDSPEILRKLSRSYFFQAEYLKSIGKHAEAVQKFLHAKKYSEEYLKANSTEHLL